MESKYRIKISNEYLVCTLKCAIGIKYTDFKDLVFKKYTISLNY